MTMAAAGTGAISGAGAAPAVVVDGQGAAVHVWDAGLLTQGDYARAGTDLTITGPDGSVVVVKGFFLTDTPPDIAGPDGMVIAGSLAERLAGPRVPGGQLAQAGEQVAQAAPIGTVEKIDGTVTVERADGTVVELRQGDAVYEDDIVMTGGDGKIGLVFLDGSEFSLGGNGRMVLDEMVFDPASGDGSSSVSLVSGTLSFISGQIAKASPDGATVKTPIATIGIRGTSGTIRIAGEDVGAAEQLQVVLIPDPGGLVGEIIITTPAGQVTTLNVPFNGLNMVGGLIQTFTISATDFVQEYGHAVDYLRSDFGDTLPPSPNQEPGETDGGDQGREGQDDDRNSGLEGQEFGSDVVKVVLDERGHGIDERPDIVPAPDYGRAPPPAGGEDQEQDASAQGNDDQGAGNEVEDDDDENDDDAADDDPGAVKVVVGSPRGDVLQGSTGADSIFGGEGGDTLVASAGDDTLNGGDGEDWVSYEAFTDNLSIDLSAGTVAKGVGTQARSARASVRASADGETGTLGTDTLISIENITGGAGDDTFIGDAGNNTFIGGAGRDTFSFARETASVSVDMTAGVATGAGIGTDRFSGFENVIGGAGDDTFVGDAGNNTLIGGAGRDTVSFANQSASVSVNLSTGLAVGSGIGRDTLSGIETVIGGSGSDAFVGDAGDNGFVGGAGNDALSYSDQTRGVTVNVSTGVATGAGIGTDTFSGIEYFLGGAGNDTFIAGSGGNAFVGGAGSDTASYAGRTSGVTIDVAGGTVSGGGAAADSVSGIETFIGGSGNDTFVAGSGGNAFVGGAGADVASYAGRTSGVTVNVSAGTVSGGGAAADTVSGIETFVGGAGNDTFVAGSGGNAFVGGAGSDTVSYAGQSGAVSVDLGTGYGSVQSHTSARVDSTPSPQDRLSGIENAIGGSGNDHFVGNAADNTFVGGAGSDTIDYSGAGAGVTVNLATGTATGQTIGTDKLVGIENILGGAGNDVLTGSAGTNYINAGAGNDTVYFSAGGDSVNGGSGTDSLVVTQGGTIDLTGSVTQIEVVDLRGGGGAVLELSPGDVAAITGNTTDPVLRVRGNSGDEVSLDGTWTCGGTVTVDNVVYDVYTASSGQGTMTVQLEQGLYDPPVSNAAPTLVSLETVYWANMDTDPGWTGLGSVSDGGWAWGSGTGSSDPGSGATGTSWVGFNLTSSLYIFDGGETYFAEGGDYLHDMPATSVMTDAITLDGAAYVRLDFMRWLGVEGNEYDHASIEVSTDGATWSTVWSNPDYGIIDDGWVNVSYDLSQWAGGHDRMYVRWTMGPTDEDYAYGGWNIDDVRVVAGDQAVTEPSLPDVPLFPVEDHHAGALVSDLLDNAADVDGDSLGIAIVAADTAHGDWEYSLDGGETWTAMDEVSSTDAMVLGPTARIRFTPDDPSFGGGNVAITYHAWDGSDGNASGTAGVDLSHTGGSTAYSEGTQTVTVKVNGPNTAPVIEAGMEVESVGVQYDADSLTIDVIDLDGESRGQGGGQGEGEGEGEGDPMPISPVYDTDGPFFRVNADEGYAIVGTYGDGTWEYSTDWGTTWTAMPAVTADNALVLVGDHGGRNKIRFVPADPAADGTAMLTLKAWDGADLLENGTTGVDTTDSPMNAYSSNTFSHTLRIGDVPDWVGGTAVFDGSAAQWDMGSEPTADHALNIYSDSGETVTFNGLCDLDAKSLTLRGSANMAVTGGYLTLSEQLATEAGTSLVVSGGHLIRAPATTGRYWTVDGDLEISGGTIQMGYSYDTFRFSGDTTARFHDGSSGEFTLKGVSFYIEDCSQGEFKNTTIIGQSANDGYSVWFSSYFYVLGGLSVAAGTDNTLDGLSLTIGDRAARALNGEMTVHAGTAAAPTTMTTGSVYNYGTITLTSDAVGGQAAWSSTAYYYYFYNRGGVVHATGAADSTYSLETSVYHQAHDLYSGLTGLIQVDSGVTLQVTAGNTIVTSEGADFLVDGTFVNQGLMLFNDSGTDLGGSGSYVNDGAITIDPNVTLTVTDAELVNNGIINVGAGSVIDLDADNDGLHMGTFTNAGGTTGSLSIGSGPALFTVDGHYGVQGEETGSVFEIGATAAGSNHDTLVVTGTMHRAGTIGITDWGSYVPSAGASFDIIDHGAADGRFHHITGLDIWLTDGIGLGVTVDDDGVTLTAHAVTQIGTVAGETLTGGAGRDVLSAGHGDDVLVSNGGNDLLFGGAGDDRFVIDGTAFNHIDGDSGTDTLVVNGSIDLSGLGGELFNSLERISLEGVGAQHLTLDSHIVQSMSRETNDLVIQGEANDSVILDGEWNDTGTSTSIGGISYSIWADADSTARVLVQDGMAAAATA